MYASSMMGLAAVAEVFVGLSRTSRDCVQCATSSASPTLDEYVQGVCQKITGTSVLHGMCAG